MKILPFNSKINILCVHEQGGKTTWKKRTGLWILFFISLLITGCNYLDYSESDYYTENEVLVEVSRVKSLLTNTYSYLPDYFLPIGSAMRSSATDEAVHVLSTSSVLKLNDGSWSAINTVDDLWSSMYEGIRSANYFLENATGLTFDDLKYQTTHDNDMIQYSYFAYEARFLRAFFYFELIKRYHNVPLVTKVLTEEEANNVESTSFDNIVNFIVTECDTVSKYLPASFKNLPGGETGRANKYVALALKARTLLYAASPLNNPSNDLQKWIDAAKAAKVIIDGGGYSLEPTYSGIVNKLTSVELILERRYADGNSFEIANFPIGYEGGNTGTCPTQNLVDSYEMKTSGLGISETGSGYNAAAPFTNRDPRLAATVIYNGSIWKNLPVECWYGGLNAPPKTNATKTGYYLKKNVVESVILSAGQTTTAKHNGVIFRYGEVLLNYAEAMNEAYGPEVAGPAPLTMTSLAAVNLIRKRATMPNFPVGKSQDQFRTKLRNERRVELAFEDHRFWDIRRWKIGETTTDIYGVDIQKDASNVITYTRKLVERRIWNDRMYFYPIPQRELFINNKLSQNQGW